MDKAEYIGVRRRLEAQRVIFDILVRDLDARGLIDKTDFIASLTGYVRTAASGSTPRWLIVMSPSQGGRHDRLSEGV
jgi:hypothetical protein